jgi:hydroxypyruvate isomerase
MLFVDLPLIARMEAAARLGYRAVEFWDWRDKDLSAIRRGAGDLGLRVVAFSGNRDHTLIDSADRAGLTDELRRSLDAAEEVDCGQLMLLTDRLLPDGSAAPLPGDLPVAERRRCLEQALAVAAELARGRRVTWLLEPLNTVLDHRGVFLDRSRDAFDLVQRVGRPEVRVLYDVYHMSMMGEDVSAVLEENLEWIGHVHVADAPGRHEPGSGRIDYRRVRDTLLSLDYRRGIGMEFSPTGSSEAAARGALELFAQR